MENKIEYMVYGKRALFTDPLTKVGGEKSTYPIPTYEALKGVTESIYWKPTLVWIIDRVRIMNPIRNESQGVRPLKMNGGNDLSIYTYLSNVSYQVQAHFEWNADRDDLAHDRNENKHFSCANRYLQNGGRRDIFLGTRECQAYVEPCEFGFGEGAYDSTSEFTFDLMYHGIDYPSIKHKEMAVRFWSPIMKNGIITFERPENCAIRKKIHKGIENQESSAIEECDTRTKHFEQVVFE